MNVTVRQVGCPACGLVYVQCDCTEQHKRQIALRSAAQEALAVLTRLADSGLPVPLGAEVDAAKARLAGVLS